MIESRLPLWLQTRGARVARAGLGFKKFSVGSMSSVIEPNPPKLLSSLTSFTELKRFIRHTYANGFSYWKILRPTPDFRIRHFKKQAKEMYQQLYQARASGRFDTLNPICTKDFFQAGKAKWGRNLPKSKRVEWSCDSLGAKVKTIRYVEGHSSNAIFQITVLFKSKQRIKVFEGDELQKEIGPESVVEVGAFEALVNSEVTREISWKFLDILDESGNGILPKSPFKDMIEEQ